MYKRQSLSGGEVKRIEIATLLARDAGLMIFDEPEAGIDLWSFAKLTETFTMLHEMCIRDRDLLLTAASAIYDPVTTTDELIPSGETSSYRSNPLKLAEFTLSRKDPAYVGRAKAIQAVEQKRRQGNVDAEVTAALSGHAAETTGLGSFVMRCV